MLKKFEITNYKNFKGPLTFDFTKGKYHFNEESIKNDVIKTAVIYGKNASGKTNLGYSVVDIRDVLFGYDPVKIKDSIIRYATQPVKSRTKFDYTFVIKGQEVRYCYEKSISRFVSESFEIDKKVVFSWNNTDWDKKRTALPLLNEKITREKFSEYIKGKNLELIGADTLNWDTCDFSGSTPLLKFLIALLPTAQSEVFAEFKSFVSTMTLIYPETYNRQNTSMRDILNGFLEPHTDRLAYNVDEFEKFLCENGVECELGIRTDLTGEKVLFFVFGKGRKIDFIQNMSSGTAALTVLYSWLKTENKSFVYLDEFDAFYHYELAENIVRIMRNSEWQTVFTTHNTDILDTDLLRPDCFFVMENNTLKNLPEKTDRELRPGHNLEKLYKGGEFNE
jgi:hypothetical protein